MRTIFGIIASFIASFAFLPGIALADSLPIHLFVVTIDGTLYDGDVTVDACSDSESGTTTSVNAFCAIEQVASSSGWTIASTWYSFGRSLDAIDRYTPDFANNRYWIYYADRAPGLASLNAHALHGGEELLLTYGVNPLRVVLASSSPAVGTSTLVRVEYFDPMLFDWVPATTTTLFLNGAATTTRSDGTLLHVPVSADTLAIIAKKEGFVDSQAVTMTPYVPYVPPSTTVHLLVVASSTTLFDAEVNVTACPDTQTGTTTSINAFCAVAYAASSSGWTLDVIWYPFGAFLNGVGGYKSDFGSGLSWSYFVNGEPGMSSLHAHALEEGEELILAYGTAPLRISASTATPIVGSPLTLFGEYFDPVQYTWATATGATYTVNGIATSSDNDGRITLTPSDTTPLVVTLSRPGSISRTATYVPMFVTPASTGGSATPDTGHALDVSRAIAFLRANQRADGSFGAPLYSDWVAIALAKEGAALDVRTKLANYLKTNTDPGKNASDLERRIMALLALGIDPSTGTSRDYVDEFFLTWDGVAWGDEDAVNDDIFALFPLLHLGYGAQSELVKRTVASIIAAQETSGRWDSVDLTAASIQALSPFSTLPGVTDAIAKGKAYLHNVQGDDGGFGSTYATSWVLGAIHALGESPSGDWTKNGRTPNDYLWKAQQEDGALEPASVPIDSRVWATAYAISGAQGRSWNSILASFAPAAPTTSFGTAVSGNSGEVLGTTTLAATTTSVSSSTTPVLVALMSVTSTSSSTASSSLVRPTKETPKKTSLKKPAQKTAAVTSTVARATTSVGEERPTERSWRDVLIKPFVRLFHAVDSWFH